MHWNIGIGRDAVPLFESADDLVEACAALLAARVWPRELEVDLDAKPEKPKKR